MAANLSNEIKTQEGDSKSKPAVVIVTEEMSTIPYTLIPSIVRYTPKREMKRSDYEDDEWLFENKLVTGVDLDQWNFLDGVRAQISKVAPSSLLEAFCQMLEQCHESGLRIDIVDLGNQDPATVKQLIDVSTTGTEGDSLAGLWTTSSLPRMLLEYGKKPQLKLGELLKLILVNEKSSLSELRELILDDLKATETEMENIVALCRAVLEPESSKKE